jgi:DNA-binding CsgD family transcriptional regulator
VAAAQRAAEISLILGSATSRDEGVHEALAAMRALVPYVGVALCARDPVTGRYGVLASDGYPADVLDYLSGAYFRLDAGYRQILRGPRPTARWRDVPIDYSQTYSVEAVFGPAGYREGLTARLITRDGRHTGAFHVSTDVRAHPSDESRDAIEWLVPALAAACDLLVDPAALVSSLEPEAEAAIVARDGTVMPLPGRGGSPWLGSGSELARLAATLLSRERRFLWEAPDGSWHRVHVLPVSGGRDTAVVCDVPLARLPHELTAREVDVLSLLAAGLSNRMIAERLIVAQRTVATHVEHLFQKLGTRSRTGCAAVALDEGLVREPLFA